MIGHELNKFFNNQLVLVVYSWFFFVGITLYG